jgi:Na+/proline symporter
LGIIIGYFILMIALGMYAWRFFPKATESLVGYATAGKSLGWIVMLLSAVAAQYSALIFLGFIGYMYLFGVPLATGLIWMYLSVSVVIWIIFAGRMWKLSRRFGHITPTDSVSQMYGKWVGYIFSILMMIALVTYMAAQTKGIGYMFWATTYQTVPIEVGTILAIVIVMLSTLLAGQKGTAWVGAMQGFLLLAGFFVGAVYFVTYYGGVTKTFEYILSNPGLTKGLTIPGFTPAWGYTLLATWTIAIGMGWPIHTHMYQKMISAKSPTIPRAYPFIAVANLPLVILSGFLIAVTARAFIELPKGVTPDVAFVYQAMLLFHPVALGFIGAAGLAAMQSSIDAQALGIATQVSNDFLKGKLTPKGATRLSMAIKLILTAFAVWIALASPAMILTLGAFASAFGGILAPVMLSAFAGWKRGNKYAAAIAMIAGFLVTFMADKRLHGGLLPWHSPFGMYSGFLGIITSFVLFFVLSLAIPAGRPAEPVLKEYKEVGW